MDGDGQRIPGMSTGEYLDRLLILQLKAERSPSPANRQRYEEWDRLRRLAIQQMLSQHDWMTTSLSRLRFVHEALWQCEDEFRRLRRGLPEEGEASEDWLDCRQQLRELGTVAVRVIDFNDKRARIKRELDERLGELPDTKSYQTAQGGDYVPTAEAADRAEAAGTGLTGAAS